MVITTGMQDQTPLVDVTETVAQVDGALDFSIVGMFMQADLTVQAVMLMLIVASVWSWSIIVNTRLRLNTAKKSADGFEEKFWSGKPLDELYSSLKTAPKHPLAAVSVAAMRELQRSLTGKRRLDKITVQDRIAKVMHVTGSREMERLEGQVSYLATIGSAAPFVGLFGTVWGIMNAFQDIAIQADTSLNTVAPGIAEALLATALGLVAAIPAVIAYNNLATDLGRYAGRVDGFADEFAAILSRQLDEQDH